MVDRPTDLAAPAGARSSLLASWLALLGASGCVAPTSAPPCGEWTTPNFYTTATLAEVATCIESGADPNARLENTAEGVHVTPLLSALLAEADPNIVLALLDAGADPRIGVHNGRATLDLAVYHSPQVVRALLEAGAEVNRQGAEGYTALHLAPWSPLPVDVASALLAAGADVHARDSSGRQPLHNALLGASGELASRLIAAGADVNAADRLGSTPLHEAVHARFGGDEGAAAQAKLAAVSELLAHAADPSARDAWGATPLLHVTHVRSQEARETIERLVRAGASVAVPDKFGNKPIHQAATWNADPAVLHALLAAGADVNAEDGVGNTPLHRAAYWNSNAEVTTLLLQAGAKPHAPGQDGNTPLHYALRRPSPQPKAVRALLAAGADPETRNAHGETPCDQLIVQDEADALGICTHDVPPE